MAPSVRPSTVWGQNWSLRQVKQCSMVARLLGQLRSLAQLGDLAALDLVDEHVARLHVAVRLELDGLRHAVEARETLDVAQKLPTGVVPGLDPADEDAGRVVALAGVRAGGFAVELLVPVGKLAALARELGRGQAARAGEQGALPA